MNNDIKLILKGFIIGLGKIIPGVSGAVFAMMLNVYQPALNAITNIKKDFFSNFKFLLLLGIGIILAIVFGSNILLFFLNKFYLQTMFLFVGLMINGIFDVIKEVQHPSLKEKIIAFVIVVTFGVISLMPITTGKLVTSSTILYFFSGVIDAFASIVPGISGTALLMLLGTYYPILNSYATILNFELLGKNILLLIPFFLGIIFGAYFISKIINYAFNQYKNICFCCIVGFIITSILVLLCKLNIFRYNLTDIIISLVFLIVGALIAKKVNI